MWPPRISPSEKNCLNCKWFTFAERFDKFGNRAPDLNRECTYPGKIRTKGGVCRQWKDMRTFRQKLKGERVIKGFCGNYEE